MIEIKEYADYARTLRHELHQCPELGFDLTETLAVVRRELDNNGISYTEKWGRSSVVATINEEKKNVCTIGFRADMDALPISEKSANPYPSHNEGCMHACGHDVHTSGLLAFGKWVNDHKDEINCRVKLLFTPAEEYIQPGCKEMAENGVMDDIDFAVALHVSPTYRVGQIGVNEGSTNANSMGFTVKFKGRSAHAANQEKGIDAISMAVEAYQMMEIMAAKEFRHTTPRLLNIGTIHGGKTNNVICDECTMFGSARAWSDEVVEKLERRIQEIGQAVAASHGGEFTYTRNKLLPYVANDPKVHGAVLAAAEQVIGKEGIKDRPRALGGEDFGFLSRKKPCDFFFLGTSNGSPETSAPVHNDHYDADESCFEVGIGIFAQFLMNNMNGLSAE